MLCNRAPRFLLTVLSYHNQGHSSTAVLRVWYGLFSACSFFYIFFVFVTFWVVLVVKHSHSADWTAIILQQPHLDVMLAVAVSSGWSSHHVWFRHFWNPGIHMSWGERLAAKEPQGSVTGETTKSKQMLHFSSSFRFRMRLAKGCKEWKLQREVEVRKVGTLHSYDLLAVWMWVKILDHHGSSQLQFFVNSKILVKARGWWWMMSSLNFETVWNGLRPHLSVRLGAKQLWHHWLGIAVKLMPCARHELLHPGISNRSHFVAQFYSLGFCLWKVCDLSIEGMMNPFMARRELQNMGTFSSQSTRYHKISQAQHGPSDLGIHGNV